MANFHISRHYLGNEANLTPRIPVSQNPTECAMAPRVCASESLNGCWESIKVCHDLVSAMKQNKTLGYYFFVYELSGNFVESGVIDSHKTGEVVSYSEAKGRLLFAFYVDSYRLTNSLESAAEKATIQEAISAYNEWQKDDILKIERSL